MAVINGTSLFAAAILLFVTFYIPKRNKVNAKRIGIDPGLLGFKTLAAKINFLLHGHSLVNEQYLQSKDENYLLQGTNTDTLVLPPKYLPELRSQNSSTLSHAAATARTTLGGYSGVDIVLKDRQSFNICRGRLTKSLPTIIPPLAKELQTHLREILKDCSKESYTPYVARELADSLNKTASSLILVGPALTHTKEWREALSEIQPAIASVVMWLTPLPEAVQPIVAPFLSATRRLKSVRQRIREFLFAFDKNGAQITEFPTILQHYIATSKVVDEQEITSKFCVLSSSMTHTVTNATTQALFDLCQMPHYISDLREELQEALHTNNGDWKFDVTKKLLKMDSFLKESARWNPFAYLSFNRIVMTNLKLSDGTTLPKGQHISMPAGPMTMDPSYIENPEQFDGYRFYKKHVSSNYHEGDFSQHEFANTGSESLQWGNGRLACPGRWYASAVMKIMIGTILLEYDIRFPDGQTERPRNAYLDTMIQPDGKQVILFRKRN